MHVSDNKDEGRSRLARALARVLDGGKGRRLWAARLDVTKAALSQWVNDQTLPRPHHLRAVLASAREIYGPHGPPLLELVEALDLPAREATPHHQRVVGTLGTYALQPLREGFERVLAALPTLRQEEVLYVATDLARAARKPTYEATIAEVSKVLTGESAPHDWPPARRVTPDSTGTPDEDSEPIELGLDRDPEKVRGWPREVAA